MKHTNKFQKIISIILVIVMLIPGYLPDLIHATNTDTNSNSISEIEENVSVTPDDVSDPSSTETEEIPKMVLYARMVTTWKNIQQK